MKRMVITQAVLVMAVGFSAQKRVPPPLEAKDCASIPHPDELPNDRFARMGGESRKAKVSRHGTALTVDDVAQGRDPQFYEKLELADPEPDGGSKIIPQARIFLWEHWRKREQAYLMLTLSSVDATSTSHVFIEQDQFGRWRVYWRIVRHNDRVDDMPTTYAVRWVNPARDWKASGTPLAEGQEPDAVRHRLEFRDVCGDVERSF